MSFIEELKRRKVIRVGIAYLIGAWLLLQLSDVLSELLDLPDKFGPVVVALVAIGFPITLLMSWLFEFTTEGLKRETEVEPGQRSSGKLLNLLVVVMLVAALGYFVWESRFSGRELAEPANEASAMVETATGAAIDINQVPSIAVLPFENFSGKPEDEYFADGLADTLLHNLAQIPGLKVIARNSSFQYKGSNKDVREIGQELDVSTVLQGSVQRAGNQVRIIAQLVNTRDGVNIFSEIFEGSMDDIFALQDQVASALFTQLEVGLTQLEYQRLMQNGTDIPEAYDLLLKATNNAAWDVEKMIALGDQGDEVVGLIRQALELDPDYAEAWVGLSRRYNGFAFVAQASGDHDRFVAEAQAAANKAIELAPDYYGGHMALGWVSHRKGDRLAAITQFRRALELNPNDVESLSGLGLQLTNSNPEEALALFTRSQELAPTATITHRQRHFALLRLGRNQEAFEELEAGLRKDPSFGLFYTDIVERYEEDQGRPDLAATRVSELLDIEPNSRLGQFSMSSSWHSAGGYARAIDWIMVRLSLSEIPELTIHRLAGINLSMGRYQEALDWLNRLSEGAEGSDSFRSLTISACLALARVECADSVLAQQRLSLQQQRETGRLTPAESLFVDTQALLLSELNSPDGRSDFSSVFIDDAADPAKYWHFELGGHRAWYLFAGLATRRGDLDTAFQYLENTLPDDGLGVFTRDPLGFDVERSLLLEPLRADPRFSDWHERYRTRRDAMQTTMRFMEARGEIPVPEAASEISAL